jgi:D-glycerate 3-kinase
MNRVDRAPLEDFIARERLPEDFAGLVEALHAPLVDLILQRRAAADAPLVVGLCGPQGSGKTTGARVLDLLLAERGVRSAVLALDDLYLPRRARESLARTVHPLLATRGPPGTHDPELGAQLIAQLGERAATPLPRFDKAADDRTPPSDWPIAVGPAEVVIFEGWCVGARPQASEDLVQPINGLEATRDPHGLWRSFVNDALAGPYQSLFGAIGLLVMLRPPAFEVILRWRLEQERKLREVSDGGAILSDEQVRVFIQHFERVARHLDQEMPARADVVIDLDEARRVVRLERGGAFSSD